MANMKFKAGDRVRIKSIGWYNENINEIDEILCGNTVFIPDMVQYISDIVTISKALPTLGIYRIKEDSGKYNWTDEMIEGLVEEEEVGLVDKLSSRWVNEFNLPDGYIFKDENGNVINATKIVLEKKKTEYPKTYEECCEIVKVGKEHTLEGTTIRINYKIALLESFQKLLICRDAYWKIAGAEMGLGKPWKPDWEDKNTKYSIYTIKGVLTKAISCYDGAILAFPTEEMRDAFYENFKKEIEICKELL